MATADRAAATAAMPTLSPLERGFVRFLNLPFAVVVPALLAVFAAVYFAIFWDGGLRLPPKANHVPAGDGSYTAPQDYGR